MLKWWNVKGKTEGRLFYNEQQYRAAMRLSIVPWTTFNIKYALSLFARRIAMQLLFYYSQHHNYNRHIHFHEIIHCYNLQLQFTTQSFDIIQQKASIIVWFEIVLFMVNSKRKWWSVVYRLLKKNNFFSNRNSAQVAEFALSISHHRTYILLIFSSAMCKKILLIKEAHRHFTSLHFSTENNFRPIILQKFMLKDKCRPCCVILCSFRFWFVYKMGKNMESWENLSNLSCSVHTLSNMKSVLSLSLSVALKWILFSNVRIVYNIPITSLGVSTPNPQIFRLIDPWELENLGRSPIYTIR